jgi:hypothetical protein
LFKDGASIPGLVPKHLMSLRQTKYIRHDPAALICQGQAPIISHNLYLSLIISQLCALHPTLAA